MICHKKANGFALATTLIFLSLLAMMVLALLMVVRPKLFLSQTQADQTASLYLAELAIADAMTQLEASPDWTGGFLDKQIPGVRGSYTLSFNTGSGPFTDLDSINNYDSRHRDSYRGEGTLRRGQALLVATASVGKASRTVEALVEIGGGLPPLEVPILADGVIFLQGTSLVEGVRSLSDQTRVEAGVHSNTTASNPDLVNLSESTATTSIDGLISSSGANPGAINLGAYGPNHTAGTQTATPVKPFPPVDILSQISAKTAAPGLPGPIAGVTVLNASASPDFFHLGDLSINGDLRLNGASLYVNGKLDVNGSIEGHGSVYVADSTTFKGSSKVVSFSPDKVALYSQ